jgi:hypothetical protein
MNLHYVVFFILLLPPLPYVQMFSSAHCSQTFDIFCLGQETKVFRKFLVFPQSLQLHATQVPSSSLQLPLSKSFCN